jgi:hypothetical protein
MNEAMALFILCLLTWVKSVSFFVIQHCEGRELNDQIN